MRSRGIATRLVEQIRLFARDHLPQRLELELACFVRPDLLPGCQRTLAIDEYGLPCGFRQELRLTAPVHGDEPPSRFIYRVSHALQPVISQDKRFAGDFRNITRSWHPRTGITTVLLHLSTTTELVVHKYLREDGHARYGGTPFSSFLQARNRFVRAGREFISRIRRSTSRATPVPGPQSSEMACRRT
jgi:hypothetical protein